MSNTFYPGFEALSDLPNQARNAGNRHVDTRDRDGGETNCKSEVDTCAHFMDNVCHV